MGYVAITLKFMVALGALLSGAHATAENVRFYGKCFGEVSTSEANFAIESICKRFDEELPVLSRATDFMQQKVNEWCNEVWILKVADRHPESEIQNLDSEFYRKKSDCNDSGSI